MYAVKQVLLDKVKVTILPGIEGFNIEIEGTQYESDNELQSWDTRSEMLECLAEIIAIHAADHYTEDEHELFLDVLHEVNWNEYL